MRLSFFIKPNTEALREINELLQEAGFEVVTKGHVNEQKDRIIIFNERSRNNFCFSAHKLISDPSINFSAPFLVRVGSNWTLHGLVTVLRGYLVFRIPYFRPVHFPSETDFDVLAINDEKLLKRLDRIRKTIKNCQHGTQKELMEVEKILRNLNGKSSGEIKREIFYFMMSNKRLDPPWGDPPSGLRSRNIYIDWLREANESFPREESTDRRFKEDLLKIKKMEGVEALKLI